MKKSVMGDNMLLSILLLVLSISTVTGQAGFQSSQDRASCFIRPDTGTCRAFLPAFFYNEERGICDCFIYGGCSPGGNLFATLQDCMDVCGVNPNLQIITGECRRLFPPRRPSVVKNPDNNASSSAGPSGSSNSGSSVGNGSRLNDTSIAQLQEIFNQLNSGSSQASSGSSQQAPSSQGFQSFSPRDPSLPQGFQGSDPRQPITSQGFQSSNQQQFFRDRPIQEQPVFPPRLPLSKPTPGQILAQIRQQQQLDETIRRQQEFEREQQLHQEQQLLQQQALQQQASQQQGRPSSSSSFQSGPFRPIGSDVFSNTGTSSGQVVVGQPVRITGK